MEWDFPGSYERFLGARLLVRRVNSCVSLPSVLQFEVPAHNTSYKYLLESLW